MTNLDTKKNYSVYRHYNKISQEAEAVAQTCSHCTKKKSSIKDFFSKCDQIRSFLRIWSHLLKKSLMENFIFWAVSVKKVFLEISQNSQENTCARVSFLIKLQACGQSLTARSTSRWRTLHQYYNTMSFPLNMCDSHLRCPMMGEVSLET